jgi:hypothetical protein
LAACPRSSLKTCRFLPTLSLFLSLCEIYMDSSMLDPLSCCKT